MSVRNLQIIVGKAVISDEFRAGILNGRRAELIRGFALDPEEEAAVMAIQADTLAEFAGAVEQIARSREIPYLVLNERSAAGDNEEGVITVGAAEALTRA